MNFGDKFKEIVRHCLTSKLKHIFLLIFIFITVSTSFNQLYFSFFNKNMLPVDYKINKVVSLTKEELMIIGNDGTENFLYNFNRNFLCKIQPMNIPRKNFSFVFKKNGNFLIFRGNVIEEFDIKNRTFTRVFSLNDNVLFTEKLNKNNVFILTKDFYFIFDLLKNKIIYSKKIPFNFHREIYKAIQISENKILITGEFDYNNRCYFGIIYDGKKDEFNPISSIDNFSRETYNSSDKLVVSNSVFQEISTLIKFPYVPSSITLPNNKVLIFSYPEYYILLPPYTDFRIKTKKGSCEIFDFITNESHVCKRCPADNMAALPILLNNNNIVFFSYAPMKRRIIIQQFPYTKIK